MPSAKRQLLLFVGILCILVIISTCNGSCTGNGDFVALTSEVHALQDSFGKNLAISGSNLVIGSHAADDYGSSSGAAHVFHQSEEKQWKEVQRLTASDGHAGAYFGISLAIEGSVIVVGAYFDNNDHPNSGSVYIFTETDPLEWFQTAKLSAKDGDRFAWFGWSVGLFGSNIIIGAPLHAKAEGAAYVFTLDTGHFHERLRLHCPMPTEGHQYGGAVAVYDHIYVVGSKYAGKRSKAGAVFVYVIPNDEDTHAMDAVRLVADDASSDDLFGVSVAIYEKTIAVGAYADDDTKAQSGSVYIFRTSTLNSHDWVQYTKIHASDPSEESHFGWKVALVEQMLLVSAYHDGRGVKGAVYLFRNIDYLDEGSSWTQVRKVEAIGDKNNQHFGTDIGLTADATVVVGDDLEGVFIAQLDCSAEHSRVPPTRQEKTEL